ncbi:MAG TPA: branched-chain amino acid ABC transporter permease, partial [Anaerolineae bacterium]|nr:branched-chain amino acid ABC transporter permease [Anaerolineae bacterium]
MIDESSSEINRNIQGATLVEDTSSAILQIIGWVALVAVIAALLLAPMSLSSYGLFLLSFWAVTTIAVQGLNLTMGYAGKISLAQAAFMGIGAYTSTLLIQNIGLNYWIGLVIATIVCTLIGALIGFPALRVQGHYLAFVTLGFNELVILVLRNEDWLTGGPLGILDIARPSIFGFSLFEPVRFYYFCMVMLALVSLAMWYMIRSPWGRAFKALRDNPYRAESLGLSTTTYTLLAFAIGSGLAGIAGAMLAPLVEFIDPQSFGLQRSLIFLLMVMVGGRGTLAGPFIGVFFVILLPEWLRFTEEYYLIIFSIFVILLIMFFPQGVAGIGPYLQKRFSSNQQKE